MAVNPRVPTQAEQTLFGHRLHEIEKLMDERARDKMRRSGNKNPQIAPRNGRLLFMVLLFTQYGYTGRDLAQACHVSQSRCSQVMKQVWDTLLWFGLIMTGPHWEHQGGWQPAPWLEDTPGG